MQYVSDWVTKQPGLLLNFSESVLEVFREHVQSGSRPESGGVLLGTVHEPGLLVTIATVPTRLDKRYPFLFERSPFGHRAIARRKWRGSGGLVRYIGEWHTHPQNKPTPSSIDLEEWRKLAALRADRRPLLAVIVGRHELHVELTSGDGDRTLLKPFHNIGTVKPT